MTTQERQLYTQNKRLSALIVDYKARINALQKELEKAHGREIASFVSTGIDSELETQVFEAIKIQYPYAESFMLVIKSRKTEYVIIRQLFQALIKRHTKYSLKRIGLITGGKDHATIKNSIKVVSDMCDTDRVFKSKFEAIEAKIKQMLYTPEL